jgi:hypothetical protein
MSSRGKLIDPDARSSAEAQLFSVAAKDVLIGIEALARVHLREAPPVSRRPAKLTPAMSASFFRF